MGDNAYLKEENGIHWPEDEGFEVEKSRKLREKQENAKNNKQVLIFLLILLAVGIPILIKVIIVNAILRFLP